MDYLIRIAYDDSMSRLRGYNKEVPNQGILQGNGSRSVAWVITSTYMITLMKRLKHKLIQLSAISKEKLSIIGFIFVDNTDLTKGKLHQSTTEIDEILEEI